MTVSRMNSVGLHRFSHSYRRLGTLLALGLVGGCFDLDGDDIEQAIDDLDEIPVCGNMTLEELYVADEISDECRDELESFLPEPENTFENRLISLGETVADDGSRVFYIHGATHDGAAISADAFAEATVTATVDGETMTLPDEAYTIVRVEAGDIISLGLVNDYSGSMLDQDLDAVEEIHRDMFTYLPPVYEAEVTQFSDEVDVRQAYTTDAELLAQAITRDDAFERGSTALYDGMGASLDQLISRERPGKILMVSTDGAENASMRYEKAQLIDTARANGVIVVMLGALLADVDEMRDLAAGQGIVFYTRYYSSLRAQMQAYLESLGEIVEVRLAPEWAEATDVVVAVDGVSN